MLHSSAARYLLLEALWLEGCPWLPYWTVPISVLAQSEWCCHPILTVVPQDISFICLTDREMQWEIPYLVITIFICWRSHPNIPGQSFTQWHIRTDRNILVRLCSGLQTHPRMPCSTIPYCNVLYTVSCIIRHEVNAQPQFKKVLFNPIKLRNAS